MPRPLWALNRYSYKVSVLLCYCLYTVVCVIIRYDSSESWFDLIYDAGFMNWFSMIRKLKEDFITKNCNICSIVLTNICKRFSHFQIFKVVLRFPSISTFAYGDITYFTLCCLNNSTAKKKKTTTVERFIFYFQHFESSWICIVIYHSGLNIFLLWYTCIHNKSEHIALCHHAAVCKAVKKLVVYIKLASDSSRAGSVIKRSFVWLAFVKVLTGKIKQAK